MKLKILFKTIFILVFSINTSISFGQEKPLRIGVKVGVPNILTANIEYVTPLLNGRVALSVDYMSLSKTIDDVSINYDNFEIGSNIYIKETGKGLYGGISYFSFTSVGTYVDTEFDGFVIMHAGVPLLWKPQLQTEHVLSSTKSEFTGQSYAL